MYSASPRGVTKVLWHYNTKSASPLEKPLGFKDDKDNVGHHSEKILYDKENATNEIQELSHSPPLPSMVPFYTISIKDAFHLCCTCCYYRRSSPSAGIKTLQGDSDKRPCMLETLHRNGKNVLHVFDACYANETSTSMAACVTLKSSATPYKNVTL